MTAARSSRRRPRLWPVVLLLSLTLAVALLPALFGSGERLSAAWFSRHLLWPLARLLAFMGLGLLVGQAIESLGWGAALGRWLAPLLRWGRLKPESGAAFTAACFSGILANSMLVTFHQEGRLSRREMILSYLFNNGLPVFFFHLPTTFFIIYPLVREAGVIYLSLTLIAAVLRSAGILAYTRATLPAAAGTALAVEAPARPANPLMEIWRKFRSRFGRVVLYTLPIYAAIASLNEMGFFRWLRQQAGGLALDFLPMEAAGVVIFSLAAEFTAGMAAAGALLDSGALTVKQTVLALILGTMVATPIRALRHQLPTHAGIFSPGLGAELLLLSQGTRLASLAVVTVAYGVWG